MTQLQTYLDMTKHQKPRISFFSPGKEKLVRVDGQVDEAKYKENTLWNESSLRLGMAWDIGQRFTFQQDNDNKHTTRATMESFRAKYLS